MMSTLPRSAWAIRRTSATCQSTPTPRQSHWNLSGDAHDRVGQLFWRLVVVLTVGQQDRMPLHESGHRVEEPASEGEPGSHRRAPVGTELADGLMCSLSALPVHPDHARSRAYQRKCEVGLVGAGNDREPGAVKDLIHGSRRPPLLRRRAWRGPSSLRYRR